MTKGRKAVYGKELEAELVTSLKGYQQTAEDRRDRIRNGQTDDDDCFISMNVNDLGQRKIKAKLEILRGDGMREFDALLNLKDGSDTGAEWVYTKHGSAWHMPDGSWVSNEKDLLTPDGEPTNAKYLKTKFGFSYLTPDGTWINAGVKDVTLEKKGYKRGDGSVTLASLGYKRGRVRKPAWVRNAGGGGGGMAGAMNITWEYFESGINYKTG